MWHPWGLSAYVLDTGQNNVHPVWRCPMWRCPMWHPRSQSSYVLDKDTIQMSSSLSVELSHPASYSPSSYVLDPGQYKCPAVWVRETATRCSRLMRETATRCIRLVRETATWCTRCMRGNCHMMYPAFNGNNYTCRQDDRASREPNYIKHMNSILKHVLRFIACLLYKYNYSYKIL